MKWYNTQRHCCFGLWAYHGLLDYHNTNRNCRCLKGLARLQGTGNLPAHRFSDRGGEGPPQRGTWQPEPGEKSRPRPHNPYNWLSNKGGISDTQLPPSTFLTTTLTGPPTPLTSPACWQPHFSANNLTWSSGLSSLSLRGTASTSLPTRASPPIN